MNIRPLVIRDYDNLLDLWLSCHGMGLNNLDDSREGIERFLARNPDTCFVCEGEGRLIGAIMAGSDGRRGYIYHTCVREEYRHQGIGTQLVDTVMSALESLGIHKAALVVFARNEAGNAFWEKMGFTRREDIVYRNKVIHEMIRRDT